MTLEALRAHRWDQSHAANREALAAMDRLILALAEAKAAEASQA